MISVTILTKNSSKTLKKTLLSVRLFPEVVIFDTGSIDDTLKIAKEFPNVEIYEAPFEGFGKAHNEATACASYDWILSLDSDEVVSPSLAQEILALEKHSDTVYAIERANYYDGKRIRYCAGWYPDWVIRLYHRGTTRFSEDAVHERVLSKGLKIARLKNQIDHTPYHSFQDLLIKMERYSTLFAQQHCHQKRSSFAHAVVHSGFAFFKSYILKYGILGGKIGFILSMHNAKTTFRKYLKLAQLNKIV